MYVAALVTVSAVLTEFVDTHGAVHVWLLHLARVAHVARVRLCWGCGKGLLPCAPRTVNSDITLRHNSSAQVLEEPKRQTLQTLRQCGGVLQRV